MKKIIILIIVLLIYSVAMYFIFNGNVMKNANNNENSNNNTENSNNSSDNSTLINTSKKLYYLVINNETNLRYNEKNWYETNEYSIEDYGEYDVYVNKKSLGKYKLRFGEKWNIMDSNNKFINYEGDFIAGSTNLKLKVRNYNVREVNSEEKSELLSRYSIKSFNNLGVNEVVEFDLDHNNTMDKIISVSNLGSNDGDNDINVNDYFSVVLLKLNDNYIVLKEDLGEITNKAYYLNNIINVLDNNVDSFILTSLQGVLSEDPVIENKLYSYKNNTYSVE